MVGNWFHKRAPAVSETATAPHYTPDSLTLRIKHRNFIEALQAHGVPAEQMPITRPLCGELIVSYAFDLPGQFIMATPPLLAKAGIGEQDLDALAQANFKGKLSAQLVRKAGREGVLGVRTGQDLEAVLLVLDGFWNAHVKEHTRGEIVACAPRRDTLLIADLAVSGAIEGLREEAEQAFNQTRDAHALSLQLMKWTGQEWELFAH